ncbi:MAG: U32 family peptidase, partial [Spirochaetaceae bacterium]|nr:U32 family peptidase [Spirochaetaceae bacterium]
MELVSPAGNVQKLRYAYEYGADSVYIGLKNFSLRVKADNFHHREYEEIAALKERFPGKKLFCALNISFHNRDLDQFMEELSYFGKYPFDAFIVQDIGMAGILKKHFPRCSLHLSTQANCINREAAKVYRDLGFKRIVLG